MKFVEYSLNGISFSANKIFIQESKGLLDKLTPKPRKAYDWAEQHGKAIDLSAPKYEEREITLKGWVQGDDWQEMKRNFDTLLAEFDKEGLARLIVNFGKELVYDVYLVDSVELEKKFNQGRQIGFFTLKMREPSPIKKVLKLIGSQFNLSFSSKDWIKISVDGMEELVKGSVRINKQVKSRFVKEINKDGRNLVLESGTPKSKDEGWIIYPLANVDISGKYTLQIWLENTTPSGSGVGFGSANGYNGVYIDYPHLQDGVYTKTLNINKGNDTHLCIWVNNQTTIRKIKLEKGNKPTDWTPAPEDVYYIVISGNVEQINNLETNAEVIWN